LSYQHPRCSGATNQSGSNPFENFPQAVIDVDGETCRNNRREDTSFIDLRRMCFWFLTTFVLRLLTGILAGEIFAQHRILEVGYGHKVQ